MKVFLSMIPLVFIASLGHAETLSEILTNAKCISHYSASGEFQGYNCTRTKSDSVRMMGIQKAGLALSEVDEFSAFETEATDLSHVNDTNKEIDIE
jgi:hypothetical protein